MPIKDKIKKVRSDISKYKQEIEMIHQMIVEMKRAILQFNINI
jgi:uncharacterized coiled-coil DUF342 family protein